MWNILRLSKIEKKRRVRVWVEARGSASWTEGLLLQSNCWQSPDSVIQPPYFPALPSPPFSPSLPPLASQLRLDVARVASNSHFHSLSLSSPPPTTTFCKILHLNPTRPISSNPWRGSHPGWWRLLQATGPPWSRCEEEVAAARLPLLAHGTGHLPVEARLSLPANSQDIITRSWGRCGWTRLLTVFCVGG